MPRADNAAIKHDLMADHVPYEIWMLRATADGLRTHPAPPPVIFNAYIEAFAIHARSLINFFNGKDGCHAVDFTVNYVPFANGKIEERLERKLNAQIPHITEHRFNTVEEKLNTADIAKLRQLIDAEISRFLDHMQREYKDVWDTKKRHLRQWVAKARPESRLVRGFVPGLLCGAILVAAVWAGSIWWKSRTDRSPSDAAIYDRCLVGNDGNTAACNAFMRMLDRDRAKGVYPKAEGARLLGAGFSKREVE